MLLLVPSQQSQHCHTHFTAPVTVQINSLIQLAQAHVSAISGNCSIAIDFIAQTRYSMGSQIAVQDGCPSGTKVSEWGPICGSQWTEAWTATVGQTYYIAVYVDPTYYPDPFNFTVTDNPLHCEAAVAITSNEFSYHGDSSTTPTVFPPCSGPYGQGLLFSWTPKASDIDSVATFSACDSSFNSNIYGWTTTSATCSESSPTCLYSTITCYGGTGMMDDSNWGTAVQFQVTSETTHYWFLVVGKSTTAVKVGKVNVTFTAAPMYCDTINITSLPFTYEVNTTKFGYTNSMAKAYAVRGATFLWHNTFTATSLNIFADTCSSSTNIDTSLFFYEPSSSLTCSTTLSSTTSSDAKYNGDWSSRPCSSFMVTAKAGKDYVFVASGEHFYNPTFTFRLSARDLVCEVPKQMQILEGGSKNISLGMISGSDSNAVMNVGCFGLSSPAGLDLVKFHLSKPTLLMVTTSLNGWHPGNFYVGLVTLCDSNGFATGCYYSASTSISTSLDAGDYFMVPINMDTSSFNYSVTVTAIQMNCSAAKKISSLPFNHLGTTVGAPYSTVNCDWNLQNTFSRGVLYSFTPSGTSVFRADLCGGKDFSAYIKVFTGCHDNGAMDKCITGLSAGFCSDYNFPSSTWQGKSGVTYYIWVGSSKSQAGNYNLTVSLYSPVNCSAAVSLTAPATVSVSLPSISYMVPCQDGIPSTGVLYSITPSADTIYIVNQTRFTIWQGCSNGYVGYCVPGTTVSNGFLALPLRGGITSYLMLSGYFTETFTFSINTISQSQCSGGRTISSLPFTENWNITSAPWYFLHFTPTGEAIKGRLFNYTSSYSATITASTCGSSDSSSSLKSKVTVFKNCGSSAILVGEASQNCDNHAFVRWTASSGTKYFILVSTTNDIDGTFQLRVYDSSIVGYSLNGGDDTLNIIEGFPLEPAHNSLEMWHTDRSGQMCYTKLQKRQIIGNLDIFGVEVLGVAWSAQRQLMYLMAKSSISTTTNIYTLDLDTGRASFVMSLGTLNLHALAYDEDFDSLYAFTGSYALEKIDVGLATLQTVCTSSQALAIDFDPCTGTLYGSGSGLSIIDKHTCAVTSMYSAMKTFVPIAVLDYPCAPHIHCSDAINWDLSSVQAYTTYYGYTNISCFGISKKGAIFKYNATKGNGKLTVTTCNPNTTFDTAIYAFTDCNHNTSAKCLGNNDNAPCLYGATASTYVMTVEYNKMYYFFVAGSGTKTGRLEFTGHLQTIDCSTAQTVLSGSSTKLSTVGKELSSISCFPNATDKQGVLFVFVGTESASIEASTCSFADFDTEIYLFTGCDHGAIGSCLASNQDSGYCYDKSTVVWDSVPGTSYFIFVTGRGTETGSFTLTVESTRSYSASSHSYSSSISSSSESSSESSSQSSSVSLSSSVSSSASSSESISSSHSDSSSASSSGSSSRSSSTSESSSESTQLESLSSYPNFNITTTLDIHFHLHHSPIKFRLTIPMLSSGSSLASSSLLSSASSSDQQSEIPESVSISSSSDGHSTPAWAAVVIAFGALGCAASGIGATYVIYRWWQAKQMTQTFSDDVELNEYL
ncbi:hypothetical protein Pelo_3943 [Pelomyxa schiedti]|nr:hypothetical protein Pelo_3943 [Pelomyxa schiedti]